MSDVTFAQDIKLVLNRAAPDSLPDALRKIEIGSIFDVHEETIDVTALGAAVIDFTRDPLLVADRGVALIVQAVEVLTGAAAAGSRIVVPSTDAASATEVVLDALGQTLTFEGNVNTVRVRWLQGPATALSTDFAPTS